jgi:hypothetical protein
MWGLSEGGLIAGELLLDDTKKNRGGWASSRIPAAQVFRSEERWRVFIVGSECGPDGAISF